MWIKFSPHQIGKELTLSSNSNVQSWGVAGLLQLWRVENSRVTCGKESSSICWVVEFTLRGEEGGFLLHWRYWNFPSLKDWSGRLWHRSVIQLLEVDSICMDRKDLTGWKTKVSTKREVTFDGLWASVPSRVLTSSAAGNTLVRVFGESCTCLSVDYTPESGITGS